MNNEENWKQRLDELEEKNSYYKLKRKEKNELKLLRKKNSEIILKEQQKEKEKEEEEIKKKEEEIRKREEEIRKREEEIRKREELKLNEKKKKMLENQLRSRKKEYNYNTMTVQQKNQQINEVLEDMCIYGEITKKEIKEEKAKHPEKFIETSQALKLENQDEGLFALGLLSQNLEGLGVETAIEVKENSETQEADLTSLQFITNGMISKKKYDLHFELGEERNEEILNNEQEYEKFKENLKLKLSKDYNISPDKIIITLPQKGSLHVQVIFQNDDFHNLDKAQFIEKFKKR